MESQNALVQLFFELASESRLSIIQELQKKNLKLMELARKLDLTDTETSRQLQRLSDASLIQKQPDGTYSLTGYAELILDMSSSLSFISKYSDYFINYNVKLLPIEFRVRLGELTGAELIDDTVKTLDRSRKMFRDAREKMDSTIEGYEAYVEIIRQRVQEGLKVRWLMEESFVPRAKSILSSDKKLPEIRITPRLPGHIIVTDKEAGITFRRNDGTMGYSAFVGISTSFMTWAEDLFVYHFERAKPWHL